jgi:propanediol dehydratase small subunit
VSGRDQSAPRYPLGENAPEQIRSRTGVPLGEITLEAVRTGRIESSDLTVERDTLQLQSAIAAQAGYRQLAANLERAAELVEIPNERLLRIYEALRPRRSTYEELLALADELEVEHGARANAQLIRQAAEAYRAAGLLPSP